MNRCLFFISLILLSSCDSDETGIFNYKDKLEIIIENPKNEIEYFILKTSNNTSSNFIELDFTALPPEVIDAQFWRDEGVLLDTFHIKSRNSRLILPHDNKSYFLHIYDWKGRKAVEKVHASKYTEHISTIVKLDSVGHIACWVYQSGIQHGIDSDLVHLFDTTNQVFIILDSVYFEDVTLEPILSKRTGRTRYYKYFDEEKGFGMAYFFNIPVRSYYGISFTRQFCPPDEKNSTLQKVES